ncbi:metallophosphoesterase [uncultured Butyricimonas sp.]|uniref:metallophosphoesterase family protein n=1 Tax=uncultured Butyricimonas sp. TaxID=1268785 RepID=UPI0026DC121B|nr:metallophosphoesterase family protein [uncultured Butyricimonas sp.]
MKVGLLSDTHGWLDPKIVEFFKACDEVWHCGDIGDVAVADALAKRFKLRAVYGNIDGELSRRMFPGTEVFQCEGVKVMMTHIGGYPGHYDKKAADVLRRERPKLFVCGHSHIAKVKYDQLLDCLHINPGAAGKFGFHTVRTAVRFEINGERIENLELIELEK